MASQRRPRVPSPSTPRALSRAASDCAHERRSTARVQRVSSHVNQADSRVRRVSPYVRRDDSQRRRNCSHVRCEGEGERNRGFHDSSLASTAPMTSGASSDGVHETSSMSPPSPSIRYKRQRVRTRAWLIRTKRRAALLSQHVVAGCCGGVEESDQSDADEVTTGSVPREQDFADEIIKAPVDPLPNHLQTRCDADGASDEEITPTTACLASYSGARVSTKTPLPPPSERPAPVGSEMPEEAENQLTPHASNIIRNSSNVISPDSDVCYANSGLTSTPIQLPTSCPQSTSSKATKRDPRVYFSQSLISPINESEELLDPDISVPSATSNDTGGPSSLVSPDEATYRFPSSSVRLVDASMVDDTAEPLFYPNNVLSPDEPTYIFASASILDPADTISTTNCPTLSSQLPCQRECCKRGPSSSGCAEELSGEGRLEPEGCSDDDMFSQPGKSQQRVCTVVSRRDADRIVVRKRKTKMRRLRPRVNNFQFLGFV